MGGGRDNNGAAIYKRINGGYIRLTAYSDKVKEVNRQIKEVSNKTGVNNYIQNKDVVLGYVKAINDRDRNAVLKLDYLLKNGKLTNDKKELLSIRKELLTMAKDSPEELNKIMADEQKNISRSFVNSYGYVVEKNNGDKIVLTDSPYSVKNNPVPVSAEVLKTIKGLRTQQIYMANYASYNAPVYQGDVVSKEMNKLVSQLGLPYQFNYNGTVTSEKWSDDISKLLGTIGYRYYVSNGM